VECLEHVYDFAFLAMFRAGGVFSLWSLGGWGQKKRGREGIPKVAESGRNREKLHNIAEA